MYKCIHTPMDILLRVCERVLEFLYEGAYKRRSFSATV